MPWCTRRGQRGAISHTPLSLVCTSLNSQAGTIFSRYIEGVQCYLIDSIYSQYARSRLNRPAELVNLPYHPACVISNRRSTHQLRSSSISLLE